MKKCIIYTMFIILCLASCKNKKDDVDKSEPTSIEPTPTEQAADPLDDEIFEDNIVIIDQDSEEGVAFVDGDTGYIMLDGIIYKILEDNKIGVIDYYEYDMLKIVIPAEIEIEGKFYSVTTICEEAFSNYAALEEVVMPDSIILIESGAFYDCSDIKKINLSKNLKEIKEQVFYGCYGLTEIILFDGLEMIGEEAFCGCEALKQIIIPSTVINIGSEAFYGCIGLESVTLSDKISIIPYGLFSGCINLTDIRMSNSISMIEDEAFWDCESLQIISIPESLISLGKDVFYNSAITSIKLPVLFDTDDSYLLSYCDYLRTVYVPNNKLSYYEELFEDEEFIVEGY